MSDEEGALATRLSIDPVQDGEFVTRLESFEGYSFGSETLGCAAVAAARSCPDRELHALHASFLRRVPPDVPVRLQVENVRDGRIVASIAQESLVSPAP